MQLIVILAVFGLANFVGVKVVSDNDLARRGMNEAEYRASVDVEEVSPDEHTSMVDALGK